MVFDLDPPEGYDFTKVVSLALDLKSYIETFGYTCFAKTTGGKGIHICCPIEPRWDFHTVFEAAQAIAQPYTERNVRDTTLQIKTEARKGRVLIDIFRIRSGQSIVSPYSLRGRHGAPVSMPLTWDEIGALKSPLKYTISNAVEKVLTDGDAWKVWMPMPWKSTHREKNKNIERKKVTSFQKAQNTRATGSVREKSVTLKNSRTGRPRERRKWNQFCGSSASCYQLALRFTIRKRRCT
ncbi:MAG: hypothetical protein U5K54_25175 [Cytophagales bacterium]|nr:hypothetical protein [Cytophagales bacterium]